MARFRPGDHVNVRIGNPPGHLRTPYYIRGKQGIIERVCGEFRNPEELAYGRSGEPKKTLYRVRFEQAQIWPGYGGPKSDTIDIEIYEHWLDQAR